MSNAQAVSLRKAQVAACLFCQTWLVIFVCIVSHYTSWRLCCTLALIYINWPSKGKKQRGNHFLFRPNVHPSDLLKTGTLILCSILTQKHGSTHWPTLVLTQLVTNKKRIILQKTNNMSDTLQHWINRRWNIINNIHFCRYCMAETIITSA